MAKIMSEVAKFCGIAFCCAFFILIVNHYCQLKDYVLSLSKNLDVIVFFNNNEKEDVAIKSQLEMSNLVSVKEYVDAAAAYSKAIEKNPFLKNISVPDDAKAIQAYAVVAPNSTPDENFLLEMRSNLEAIADVDEIVFDISLFKQYVDIKNLILFYQKLFFIFATAICVLLIFKCISYVMSEESRCKILFKNIFSSLMASGFGFLAAWTICLYTQYSLCIADKTILLIVSFAAMIGIILDSAS
jgi:cell division transport system permease protein